MILEGGYKKRPARMDIVHKQVSLICHRLGDIEDRTPLSPSVTPGSLANDLDSEVEPEFEELAGKPNVETGYVQECF